MYTVIGGEDGEHDMFLMGPHPEDPFNVFVATGFQGEGFKFGPAMGEAVADTALGLPERVRGLRDKCSLTWHMLPKDPASNQKFAPEPSFLTRLVKQTTPVG